MNLIFSPSCSVNMGIVSSSTSTLSLFSWFNVDLPTIWVGGFSETWSTTSLLQQSWEQQAPQIKQEQQMQAHGFEEISGPNYCSSKTTGPVPPGMRRRSDVSFRSHIGRDVADHAETSSQRLNWYVNETDLFETSLRRLIST